VNREQLRAAIVDGRGRLEAALAGFDDVAMLDRIDDAWTRKDDLAHIEAWERRVVELFGSLRAGRPIEGHVETDELNARFHARNRDRALEDVRAGERAAYEAMLAAIDGATDDELFNDDHFGWTDGEPFGAWFRMNGDEHYDEHLEQLQRPARAAG
jgi:hypothetical protein